jgi:NAD(P)-dependent dehydrogenase (short-subunit alcohol dehydrogenase family)
METKSLLISTGKLTRQSLAGQVVIVTGAGGGIGFETARALAWLGAHAIIAEVNQKNGKAAAERINQELGPGVCTFIQTDVGDEHSVENLARQALRLAGKVDAIINNATLAPLGAVRDRSIKDWDASYRVNLRGPVLLAQAFLPGMLQRKSGVFVCVSSVGGAYMGAYETLKSAQVELAKTLDGELEGTGVIVFTIGPGIVPTATAQAGVAQIAPLYGKTTDEFFAMYKDMMISVEAAGAGFAAAVALAEHFRGLEIWSKQALITAGIDAPEEVQETHSLTLTGEQATEALALSREVRATLAKEYEGWKGRSLFERGWMLRDFKQYARVPVDQALEELDKLERCLQGLDNTNLASFGPLVNQIARYYQHYGELAVSAMKDQQKLKEWLGMIRGWQETAERLGKLLV